MGPEEYSCHQDQNIFKAKFQPKATKGLEEKLNYLIFTAPNAEEYEPLQEEPSRMSTLFNPIFNQILTFLIE